MYEERVLQPALVTQSALTLSTEVVRMILKIDDVVMTARWTYKLSMIMFVWIERWCVDYNYRSDSEKMHGEE